MDPITLSLLIGGGASILGGLFQSNAAGKAANAQERMAQQALDLQKAQIAQARLDAAPWLMAGQNALSAYMSELGFTGFNAAPTQTPAPATPATTTPTNNKPGRGNNQTPTPTTTPAPTQPAAGSQTQYGGFQQAPGYQFQVEEAEKGAMNNLAALGMKNSGAALKALTKVRSGLANQEYGNFLNRLASMAGVGQTQANTTNAMTQNSVLSQSQLMQDAGAARASGYVGGANAMSNSLSNFANNAGNWLGNYNQNWQYAG